METVHYFILFQLTQKLKKKKKKKRNEEKMAITERLKRMVNKYPHDVTPQVMAAQKVKQPNLQNSQVPIQPNTFPQITSTGNDVPTTGDVFFNTNRTTHLSKELSITELVKDLEDVELETLLMQNDAKNRTGTTK
ncbi:hypothetical protein RFI_30729 [Reticulomyxa filosa]|uniref:Uncharacterized protein n=1 Tax=Reticulomyxa filosa TaxID=46433 RepID=X6LYF4_RETFI|nr:hypothetical protein RFI_30729 [Reticulomyxa filosa]|eukprot:ETO06664.1 hypothetical protein RFI_30729 [Reticulomyxa filosa]